MIRPSVLLLLMMLVPALLTGAVLAGTLASARLTPITNPQP